MEKKKKSSDNEDQEILVIDGPPSNLAGVIESLFAPAPNPEAADDFISGADLFDTINQHCDATKTDIYNEMRNQGFATITAEGELFWLVMEL